MKHVFHFLNITVMALLGPFPISQYSFEIERSNHLALSFVVIGFCL